MLRRFGAVVVLLAASCAGGEDGGEELDTLDPAEGGELTAPQLDCRPVRLPDCWSAWNDRECFRVPEECAVRPPE